MWIKFHHHTSRGSALLISLIILVFVTLLTAAFLEVIWSSSKNVQGIEASNAAYYQAIGIVEEQLISPLVTKKTPWNIEAKSEWTSGFGTWRALQTQTGYAIMPRPWYGNSPFDDDYNIISLGEPVQIVIPDWINWTNVYFEFRVPKVSAISGTGVVVTQSNSGIVLWTVGYTGASLYASGENQIFRGADINTSTNVFSSFMGQTNTGSYVSVLDFYTSSEYLWTSGAKCIQYSCTLKLSMIRPLSTSASHLWSPDGRSLPFLEYRINFWWVPVPSQFMTLDASAYAYGFQRTYRVRIPQITTNTALDFAVLQ